MADSFSFATLFPNVVQPPISVLSTLIFSLAVRCRLCRRPVRRYDVGAPTGSGGQIGEWMEGFMDSWTHGLMD